VISVILAASDDGEALARLLTSFVPAAAEGVVREVAVLGASGAALAVADDAGAELFEAGAFGQAFERARGPWVAGMPLTAVLASGWVEVVAEHLRREPIAPARLVMRGFGLRGREGWLAPKRLAPSSAVVVEHDLQRLARGGRRLRVLDRR
jgi:hypothetical protein